MAAAAGAQEHPVLPAKDKESTVRITVSGEVVLDYVYRSRELTAFTDSLSNPSGTGALATSKGEDTFEGYAAVRFVVDLSEKVSALLEIGTRRVDGDPSASGGGGIQRWGESAANPIKLREAAVSISDFIVSDVNAQFGISGWSFDVRGRGEAFAFDPHHSQTIRRNLDQDQAPMNQRDLSVNRFLQAAFVNELSPVGLSLAYTRDALVVELVLLPAVLEGGPSSATGSLSSDESLYLVDFWYKLDGFGMKGSRVGFLAAMSLAPTQIIGGGGALTTARFYTLGGGGDLKFYDGALEIYGEAYFQMGKAGELATAAGRENVEAGGTAFQVGGQYTFSIDPRPYIALNYTVISGEKSTDPNHSEARRFAAYENVHDLLILEDQYYGIDWDSNYTVVKIKGGVHLSVSNKDDLEANLILGLARSTEKLTVPSGSAFSQLGNELDARASYHLNKQAALKFGLGYLWDSRLLKESLLQVPNNPHAKASAWLMTLGVDLSF
jgi:hypothetical protein